MNYLDFQIAFSAILQFAQHVGFSNNPLIGQIVNNSNLITFYFTIPQID